ncbi:hypothetical protein QE152_g38271 [Popillia japonica]|uniref:Uncharacterized protein n=1 Tax=Popillia japonica TaxID=7064 RepID=A0AAW1I8B9_POPJA
MPSKENKTHLRYALTEKIIIQEESQAFVSAYYRSKLKKRYFLGACQEKIATKFNNRKSGSFLGTSFSIYRSSSSTKGTYKVAIN